MKILDIMPFSPVPPDFGGALRENYLLRSLASEHEVTVLTYGDEEQRTLLKDEFGDLVEEIHVVKVPWERRFRRLAQLYATWSSKSYFHNHNCSQAMQHKIDDLLSKKNFDAVHCEFSVTGNFDFEDDLIKIVDTHNVEYENYRRMWKKTSSPLKRWFYHQEYRKVYEEEIRTLSDQDVIFSTSGQDRAIMQKDVSEVPNYVVPNGVDTSFFSPNTTEEVEPYSMVFTGMMAYTPNYDGMLYFLDQIFPLIREEVPQAKIYIVGKRPPKELKERASDHVEVTGFVDDVRPYVWKSKIFVVPLRMGSGTRLKVVESLAMKKPVVSTSIGCEGIDVVDGESILIEDSAEAFADSVIRLFNNNNLCNRIATKGHQVVKKNYEWESIGNKMLEIYDSLSSEPQAKLSISEAE